jgi:cytochrome c553
MRHHRAMMKIAWHGLRALGFTALLCPVTTVFAQAGTGIAAPLTPPRPPPEWAYPWVPDFKLPVATAEPQHLPGSSMAFSWAQARDLFFAPSWHPEDHPAMPEIVARGRKPDVRACGVCHRAEGTGGPENASLAGLPEAYIVQQMADYKSGARTFSGPARLAITLMTTTAKGVTDPEVRSAAAYFAALKPKRNIKVVEAETIPKTYIARLFFAKQPGGGTEALAQRIIEVPDDIEQFELRDSRAQFTAYVPVGSLAKGKVLVETGGDGTTVACIACHGADLRGAGPIPRIAGRSPSYLFRQLYDFKHGARAGPGSVQMKPTVANLSEGDMIALAAYLASLVP